MSTTIGIDNLTKVFGSGNNAAKAVDGATITIESGELFFLLGPSGCGKTTLLRMIAGFIDPTSGRIDFNGRDVTHLPPNKRNTGMVFQSYALWPHMSVEANVAYGLKLRKVPSAERRERALEALEAVRMKEYAARKPNQLSGGQQQRVALARALVIRPEVLLLDEPLSNLDAKLRIDLRAQIREICKASGITTVYVTHDQKEALSMADRIAIVRDGQIQQVGSPTQLYREPASEFVAGFLGETNFVEGSVESQGDDTVRVKTPAGMLEAKPVPGLNVGEQVVCSIRPESVRIAPDGPIGAEVRGTTYLGEIAQHTLDAGGINLHASELNPGAGRRDGRVQIAVDPQDVVVLRR